MAKKFCLLLFFIGLLSLGIVNGQRPRSILLILDHISKGDSILLGKHDCKVATGKEDSTRITVPSKRDLLIRHGNSSITVPQKFVPYIDEILVMNYPYNTKERYSFYIRMEINPIQPLIQTDRGKVWLTVLMESKTSAATVDSVNFLFTGRFYDTCNRATYGREVISTAGWKYDASTEVAGGIRMPVIDRKAMLQLSDEHSSILVPVSNAYPYFVVSVSNEKKGISVYLKYKDHIPVFE